MAARTRVRRFGCTWAILAVIGKATRWWSRPRTSPTKSRSVPTAPDTPATPGYHWEALRVTERFTRTGPSSLRYEATIDDPKTWVKPWTILIPLERQNGYQLFEYACHEGNYAMSNILSGSRAAEKR